MQFAGIHLDIDFHYNRREVYYSLSNGEIQRFSVNVMVNTQSVSVNLTSASSPEVLVTGTAGEVQSIAVDWVNDRLYYVEVNEEQPQSQV